jgi:4-amino-4-deoxy-L-arabinose transferase-like glycosyltransferase
MRSVRVPGPWTLLGRVPREAWICALVACLNAACWSFITPPFQVPDEPDHYSYVEQLALTGEPPSSPASKEYSSDETLALEDLRTDRVRLQPEDRAIISEAEQRQLEHNLEAIETTPIRATKAAGVATAEPPLYYVLELIPYELGAGGTVLDRLELMRLLSAAMAGLTALFVFLFAREALPRVRWAWSVAGGGVAVTPLLGFMSGGVTPEALLYAISAAAFFCMARAFRRGLTPARAAAIGAVVAIGLLTKLNFVGFTPGIAFGVVVLIGRAKKPSRATVYRGLAIAVAATVTLALAAAVAAAAGKSAFSTPTAAVRSITGHGSLLGRANYIWQFFLPRVPGMPDDFSGIFTTRQIWFNGLVGLYGWLDTTFPNWVYEAALVPTAGLALLGMRAVVASRGALASRRGELATYALMAAGLLILVGSASYTGFPQFAGAYAESRYLLPLLALMGAALALAARGAGRRWGPTVGVSILVLFVAHDIFSQLQVIARYYG